MSAQTITVSIIGATGYTGLELIRLCLAHPHVKLKYLTSRQHDNTPVGDVYAHLSGYDLVFTNTDHKVVASESDVVFVAMPHKSAQTVVADIHGQAKVIDLSADYRLDDAATYEEYYKTPHQHESLLSEIPYGWPELHRDAISAASTVANPGCFALLSQIMLQPFSGAIDYANIMAVTGSSGSGKSASDGTHHPVRDHNMKSYNINIHRHIPEICASAKITPAQLNFVPTSGPFVRGIFATAFIGSASAPNMSLYDNTPFIRISNSVALANVVGSNYCDISVKQVDDKNYIVQGALDNLVKGAAGCAVQNMNIMCGLDETTGLLNLSPLYP